MADIKINGRTTVSKLKKQIKDAFGCSLRVYMNTSCKGKYADDSATLASIRAEGFKGGELTVRGNKTVGKFETEFAELWGIGIQIANANDTKLADNDITLSAAGK